MENRYPENLRKAAVTKFINGQSAKEVCAEYGIARSTLFLWKKQYTTDKIGQIPREQYLLKKELDRLRMENTIFKTCNCLLLHRFQRNFLQYTDTKTSSALMHYAVF